MKVSSAAELGKNIVVQGGTFYNDAVLRALEKIADGQVIRPDIAGIMGAFGAALIARERYDESVPTTMLSFEEIETLTFQTTLTNCGKCQNNCRLTVNHFSDGRMYKYKMGRIFGYRPLSPKEATRGTVGIPRVLNMYEDYPFWATFFTKLCYRVVLSPPSTHKIYEMGIESIPSESECYPAKLTHGHIEWLIQKGVDFIFYPSLFYERQEFKGADNHYNCPIVSSYPENIANNVEAIADGTVKFRHPFMAFTDIATVTNALVREFPEIPRDKGSSCRLGRAGTLQEGHSGRGRTGSQVHRGSQHEGHRPRWPSLPRRPGDQPRHPGDDHELWHRGPLRGRHLPARRPVDVPLQALRGGLLRAHKR